MTNTFLHDTALFAKVTRFFVNENSYFAYSKKPGIRKLWKENHFVSILARRIPHYQNYRFNNNYTTQDTQLHFHSHHARIRKTNNTYACVSNPNTHNAPAAREEIPHSANDYAEARATYAF